jgi:hypothetical protein
MGKHPVTQKQAIALDRWERFLIQEGGCYPASLAAVKLRMTPQGVYQASERGWINFFSNGRDRWYGMKSVIAYRFSRSTRFADTRPQPAREPKNFAL